MIYIEVFGGSVSSVSATSKKEIDFLNNSEITIVDYDVDQGNSLFIKEVVYEDNSSDAALVYKTDPTMCEIVKIKPLKEGVYDILNILETNGKDINDAV